MGVGEGAGVGLGVGVGVAAFVETKEALTAPPPQPTANKIRESNITQHRIFGPMGNDLLHSAKLDAAELLDVGLTTLGASSKQ